MSRYLWALTSSRLCSLESIAASDRVSTLNLVATTLNWFALNTYKNTRLRPDLTTIGLKMTQVLYVFASSGKKYEAS